MQDQWDFILFGDSLTEVWNASQGCTPFPARRNFNLVASQYFGRRAKAFGMGGESTSADSHSNRQY